MSENQPSTGSLESLMLLVGVGRLSEVSVEKGLAGAGFEISFEFSSLLIVGELQSNQYLPWPIFGCVWGLPLIMGLKAIVQISR